MARAQSEPAAAESSTGRWLGGEPAGLPELARTDTLLRSLLASDHSVTLLGPDGRARWANRAALDFLGYDSYEQLEADRREVLDEGSATRMAEVVGRIRAGEADTADLVLRVNHPSGSLHSVRVELLAAREENGGLLYMVARLRRPVPNSGQSPGAGVLVDEGAWQAFRNAPIAMSILGPDAMLLACNAKLCEMLGYSEAELVESGLAEVNHPEDIPRLALAMKEIVEGRSDGFSSQGRVIHRSGKVLWEELNVTVVRSADGDPLYYVCQEYDLTDRKEAELATLRQRQFDRTVSDMLTEMVSGSDEDMDLQLEAIVGRLFEDTDAQWVCLGELDVPTGTVTMAFIWKTGQGHQTELEGVRWDIPKKTEFYRRVINFEQFYIKDVAAMMAGYEDWQKLIMDFGLGSVIVLPLKRSDDTIPFVSFSFSEPSDLSFEEGALYRVAADLIGTVLERARFALEKARHSEFERLLSRTAADFVDMGQSDIAEGIEEALGRICRFADASVGFILLNDEGKIAMPYEWCAEGVASSRSLLEGIDLSTVEWSFHELFSKEAPLVLETAGLPEAARGEAELMAASPMNSVVMAAVKVDEELTGCVGFATEGDSGRWRDSDMALLKVVGDLFAGALGRHRSDLGIARRVEFENLVASLATEFINLPPEGIDQGIEHALAAAAGFVGAEGAFLVQVGSEPGQLGETHGWTKPGQKSVQWAFRDFRGTDIPWLYERFAEHREPVVIGRLEEMPEDAGTDRELLKSIGIKALVAVPLHRGEEPLGVVGFSRLSSEGDWPADVVRLLKICCEMIGNAVDRREAEVALRNSEERFLQLTGTIREFFWIAEPDFSDVLYASPVFEQIYGRPFRKMSAVEFVEFIHPDDQAVVFDALLGAPDLTEPAEALYRVLHQDGTIRWVSTRVFPMRDEEGRVYRLVGISEDVTRRQEAEAAARGQQAELARVLRLNTVGEMAAGLAHEINQPLSAIISFANGCERRLRAGNARMDEIFEALGAIGEQAERSSNVIRRLRRFLAREEAKFEQVDINGLVRESVALVSSDSSTRASRMAVELEPGLPLVAVDVVQIEQVLINLLRNGLDAVAGNRRSRAVVTVRSGVHSDGAVEISVSDSGEGANGDSFEDMFEPFFTTKKDGLGMGLAISRSIVESHGGRIWAEKTDQGGLRVSFSLRPATSGMGVSDGG